MLMMMRRPEFLMMRRPEFLMMRRPEFLMMRRPCAALRRPAKGGRTASILLLPSVKFCSLSRKQKMIVQPLTRKNLLSEISGCPLGYKLSNSISGLFFLVAHT
jgi:hypothetical protein